jgi:uncharacterized protein YbjT (DUF2867 family)
MLILVGANGRTGLSILREAEDRGLPVRPVVRDDRDIDNIRGMSDVQKLCYADPMVPQALAAVMVGATTVISCIDPRNSGPGAPLYDGIAAENVVNAARDAGAHTILHLSVMGAYRWSYASLNRKAFYLEGGVRNCNAPWTILRFSCFDDEIIQAHVRPPDGKRPAPFKESSRYSPITRRQAAKAVLDLVDRIEHPGRALAMGGPQVWTGPELETLVAPFRMGGGGKSRYKALPPGDVSVAPETTQATLGHLPGGGLALTLAELDQPVGDPDPPGVYPSGTPDSHPADAGGAPRALSECDGDLRFAVHRRLIQDAQARGLDTQGATLDFGAARPGVRWVQVHGGRVAELDGVSLLGQDGSVLIQGSVDVLRDTLADIFYCWFNPQDGIPLWVWKDLDLGVQRRLVDDVYFGSRVP